MCEPERVEQENLLQNMWRAPESSPEISFTSCGQMDYARVANKLVGCNHGIICSAPTTVYFYHKTISVTIFKIKKKRMKLQIMR